NGLADRVCWLAGHGTPVLGVCGGFQMLGRTLRDPLRIESAQREAVGLGLLAVHTELGAEKRLERVAGVFRSGLPGVWEGFGGAHAEGYEIHMGRTFGADEADHALLTLSGGDEGLVRSDGIV